MCFICLWRFSDENKRVSREFNRRVEIPANFDPKTLRCFIREDGKLLVEAELPPERNESTKDDENSLSLTANSSARSYLADRLSDVGTHSPHRTDPEDMYGQSSCLERSGHRSGQETGKSRPTRGKEIQGVAPQGTDSNYLEVWSMPKSSIGELGVLRIENSKTPAEHRETEERNDLFNNHHGGLESEVPENVQKKTFRNDRSKATGGIYHNSDSRLEGGIHFQNTTDRDHLSSRLWNGLLPMENGNSVATPGHSDSDGFSVAVDIGNNFDPHELTVKAVDGKLIVHAKRSSNSRSADRLNSYCNDIYREFELPADVEPETITASLTPEGILMLEAPKNDYNYISQRPRFSNDSFFYES